jgi:competence protein ComEA
VTGKVSKPGVYHVRNGTTAGELIKLTVPERTPVTVSATLLETPVKNGDHLEVGPEGPVILKKMKGAEKMLLGIPLDPDQMDRDDWGSLPGIGPKTALKIVEDRKLHGPFRNIEGVRRVPGIGDKKFDMIKKYF